MRRSQLAPSPNSTLISSLGHWRTVSISRSYHAHPARIASARCTSCLAIVPAYRPPATRRRQVAISVAPFRAERLASSLRKNRPISASLGSQSRRNSIVRLCLSARRSWASMELASSAATTAHTLSRPNILYFQSLRGEVPPRAGSRARGEFSLLPRGTQCVKPARPLS